MGERAFESSIGCTGARTLRALSAIVLLLSSGGCTVCGFGHSDAVQAAPPPPLLSVPPAWGGGPEGHSPEWAVVQTGYSTPAWGQAPTVYGSRLHVPPGESAAGKVLALTEQTAAAKAENDRLSDRIRQLEIELDSANQALARATSEVVETRTDLVSARADLERWRHELAVMREKLEAADKDNLSTLQTTVTLLQQLVAKEEGHDEGE